VVVLCIGVLLRLRGQQARIGFAGVRVRLRVAVSIVAAWRRILLSISVPCK
jgi:hypothetical protein